MGITEDLADELALEAIRYIDATDDEEIIPQLAKSLGESSQTAEEAFMTAVRVRRANLKARAMLDAKFEKAKIDSKIVGFWTEDEDEDEDEDS
jgi:hypothetical protein